ncbi:MAG TPA: MaoC family dehydratase [Chloroflexota bacterium]|nr:MaoC family dehydratase [Chloroflexota bacterium]
MDEHVTIPAVGEALGPLDIPVTAERVRAYADAANDHNPIHLDEGFAATTHFGGTIAHGMLLLAYLSRLLSERFGCAWVENGALDARFRGPAMVGASVRVQGAVRSVTATPDGLQVECALQCADPGGQTLVQATARVCLTT